MAEKVSGRCACAGVAYEVNGPLRQVIACHCEQCRRTSGHFVAATATRKQNFQLLGQHTLRWYETVPGFKRGFCNRCGSSLFFEELQGDRISIAAGTLDDTQGMTIVAHIFAAEAGDYYAIDSSVNVSQQGAHSIELP